MNFPDPSQENDAEKSQIQIFQIFQKQNSDYSTNQNISSLISSKKSLLSSNFTNNNDLLEVYELLSEQQKKILLESKNKNSKIGDNQYMLSLMKIMNSRFGNSKKSEFEKKGFMIESKNRKDAIKITRSIIKESENQNKTSTIWKSDCEDKIELNQFQKVKIVRNITQCKDQHEKGMQEQKGQYPLINHEVKESQQELDRQIQLIMRHSAEDYYKNQEKSIKKSNGLFGSSTKNYCKKPIDIDSSILPISQNKKQKQLLISHAQQIDLQLIQAFLIILQAQQPQHYKYLSKIFVNNSFEILQRYTYIRQSFQTYWQSQDVYLSTSYFMIAHEFIPLHVDNFLSVQPWSNLQYASFVNCQIDDQGWIKLSINKPSILSQLINLNLMGNKISSVQLNQIYNFQKLKFINFVGNPLNNSSLKQLDSNNSIKKDQIYIEILYKN